MEKKSLISKKTVPAAKTNLSQKVDTGKPAVTKVVAAKKPVNALFGHHNG